VLVPARLAEIGVAPVFAATLGLSATLLFTLQPMFAKMTLPLLGGAPGVWNTAVAFFQGVLLLGYLYAHALQRLHSLKVQLLIHGAVLLVAAFFLPLAVSSVLGAPPADAPAAWLLGLYAVSVGPPFFALSASAPLLQAWYARTNRPDAADPYHLYAASNLGSLAALAAYPILVEPILTLTSQGAVWTWGYYLLAAAILACAALALRNAVVAAPVAAAETTKDEAKPTWADRGRWVLLSAIPSSLLLGATTHLATDVASAPFLWVAPLALYLLTFVIAFGRKPVITAAQARRAAPMALIAAGTLIVSSGFGWLLAAPVHLTALFVLSLACHHRLASLRPSAGRLTEFYAFMSLGGVLGGSFNAFVAPVAFDGVIEYPLALAAAAYLAGSGVAQDRRALQVGLALGLLATLAAGLVALDVLPVESLRIVVALALLAQFMLRHDAAKLAIAFLAMVGVVPMLARGGELVVQDRSFFGVWRVIDRADARELSHGTTVHGAQLFDPARRLTPLTYYSGHGPIGDAVEKARERFGVLDVGVIGLGAGSMACHAQDGDAWTFFEIDPVVVRMAKDPSLFSFLSDCAPNAPIRMGDARLTLAEEGPGTFDALVLDAFASDVVPAHLVTREAFSLYMSRLAPDGILVAHVSNRMLELEGPVTDIARSFGWVVKSQAYMPPAALAARREASPTHALVIARTPEALAAFTEADGWRDAHAAHRRPWTDDRNNIPAAMWAKRFGW
jgi:hypothetical protein